MMTYNKNYVKTSIIFLIFWIISWWMFFDKPMWLIERMGPFLIRISTGDPAHALANTIGYFEYFYSRIIGLIVTVFVFLVATRSFKFKLNRSVTKKQKITTIVIISIFIAGVLMLLLGSNLACTLFMFGCYILFDIYLIPVRQHSKQLQLIKD